MKKERITKANYLPTPFSTMADTRTRNHNLVLHYIGDLGIGGAEKQLLENVKHLNPDIFRSMVHYNQPPDDLRKDFEGLNISTVRLSPGRKVHWIKAIWSLYSAVRRYEVDIIHASVFPFDVFALIVACLTRRPVVITVANTFSSSERRLAHRDDLKLHWKSNLVHKFGYGIGVIAAILSRSKVIAISESVKSSAVKDLRFPSSRVQVIYRGLVPENYVDSPAQAILSSSLREELGFEDSYPVLVNVARLVPQKGQHLLIESMPHVLEQFPRAKLLIAGRGALKDRLKNLARELRVEENVLLLGKRDDVAALLKASDIFVFSSYYEGLGNSVVEAQASAKPVIAFDVSTLREIVEDGLSGILVKTRDSRHLADSVVSLANDRNRIFAMGQRGQEIVRQKFDIRKNVLKLETLYLDLIVKDRKHKYEFE